MRTISSTIQIGAEPMAVWAVLVDLPGYRDWNPLFREAAGTVALGQRITLRSVHPATGRPMTVKPTITVARPGAELRWISSLPGIMTGEHSFTLTDEGDGTRLVQSETYRGLLVPLSRRAFANVEAGFGELNEALRKQAEAGRGTH